MTNTERQFADAISRLAGELMEVSSEERPSHVETLVAFSRFAKACGLTPAWERLHRLAQWIDGLNHGRVAPVLTPTNTGRGTAPDSGLVWNGRVLVLVAFAMLQKAGMRQKEAARYIARKYPKLKNLMTRGKNLSGTLLRWRRDLYDARPKDFLHIYGTQLVAHEDWLKQQVTSPKQLMAGADSVLARLSERILP